MNHFCLILPFPPTTNNLFAGTRRRFPSRAYKAWREEAARALLHQPRQVGFAGPVSMEIGLGRPDRRRRDPSNYIKAVEDFIVAHGFLADDSQVEDVRARWVPDVVGCCVTMEPLAADEPLFAAATATRMAGA